LKPQKVSKVAVVGGGLMGSGIATALILSHYHVILKEVNEKYLNEGIDRIKGRRWVNLIYILVTSYPKFLAY
jgi:enoyl-CoA hydratase/3-hydroxyacyl-CoA dehydrogenase